MQCVRSHDTSFSSDTGASVHNSAGNLQTRHSCSLKFFPYTFNADETERQQYCCRHAACSVCVFMPAVLHNTAGGKSHAVVVFIATTHSKDQHTRRIFDYTKSVVLCHACWPCLAARPRRPTQWCVQHSAQQAQQAQQQRVEACDAKDAVIW